MPPPPRTLTPYRHNRQLGLEIDSRGNVIGAYARNRSCERLRRYSDIQSADGMRSGSELWPIDAPSGQNGRFWRSRILIALRDCSLLSEATEAFQGYR